MSASTTPATRPGFLRRMLATPVFEGDDDKTRIAKLLHVILLTLASVIIIFATVEILISGIGLVLVATEVTGLIYFCLWLVMRRGHVKLASIITVLLFLTSTTLLIYFTGTIRTSITGFYIVCVVIAGLLLGNRGTIVFSVLSLLALGGLIQLEVTGQLPVTTLEPIGASQWFTYAGILVIIAVLLVLSSTSLNQALARARANEQSLRQSNRELQVLRSSLEERVTARTFQLRTSAEVGRAAASILDQQQLLADTVQLIIRRFNYYYAAVFTLDSTGKWLVLREGTGEAGRIMKERGHRLMVGGESMVGMAAKLRQPRIAQRIDAHTERYDNPLLPETQSEIALPLTAGNRLLGVLNVQTTQPDAFDEDTAVVLQTMADQIATALSNTQQFEQTQTTLQQTERLYRASIAISEASDVPGALQALVEANLTDIDRALLLLFEAGGTPGHLTYAEVGGSWTRHPEDRPVPIGQQLPAEQVPFINAVTSVQPLIIRDSDDSQIDQGYRRAMGNLNIKALLGLALTAGNVNIGVVVLAYREPHSITARDIQTLQALTTQLAGTLYNQRLVAETSAALQQLDEVNQRLTGQAWRDYSQASGILRRTNVAPGYAPAMATGLLPAQLSAPVTLRNAVIGALRVEDSRPGRQWTPDEQALLEAVAKDLSLAIENQRLIEETEKRAQRERTINRITSRIRNAPTIEQMLSTAAQELRLETRASRSFAEVTAAAAGKSGQPDDRGNGHGSVTG